MIFRTNNRQQPVVNFSSSVYVLFRVIFLAILLRLLFSDALAAVILHINSDVAKFFVCQSLVRYSSVLPFSISPHFHSFPRRHFSYFECPTHFQHLNYKILLLFAHNTLQRDFRVCRSLGDDFNGGQKR